MKTKEKWIALGTVLLCLAGKAPAYAQISAINPAEGTLGTQFILSGAGFGEKRGKVEMGQERCKVISWADTQITCEVVYGQPSGDYTVTVTPQGSKKDAEPMTFSSFAVRAPRITREAPFRLVAPGEVVTIAGAFFGDRKGEVYLYDSPGQTRAAKLRDWSMNSISFEIPDGLSGTCALGIKNEVGLAVEPCWCTFTPLPPGTSGSEDYGIAGSHTCPAGIFFNGDFWGFWTDPDRAIDKVNGFGCKLRINGTGNFVDGPSSGLLASDAVPSPIVVDHELYLFYTLDPSWGTPACALTFQKYSPLDNKWSGAKCVSVFTKNDYPFAPVYNPIEKQLEVYYYDTTDSTIHWVHSPDDANGWHRFYGGAAVTGILSGTEVISSAPSAVFYQTSETNGVTLIAFNKRYSASEPDDCYVYKVKDGKATFLFWVGGPDNDPVSGTPNLADLGEDYLGLLFRLSSGTLWYNKINKNTGMPTPFTPLPYKSVYAPNMAVSYEKVVTNSASAGDDQLGARWDTSLFLLWATSGSFGSDAKATSIEHLGYWQEVAPPTAVNTGIQTNYDLWPVLGVVDAPPFVQNGEPYTNDPRYEDTYTHIDFEIGGTASSSAGCAFSCGPYIESGEKSRLKLELSATVSGEYEHGYEGSVTISQTLTRSLEGEVMAFYLAPRFLNHAVQWFGDDPVSTTTNCMYVLQSVGADIWCDKFDPHEFPLNQEPSTPGASYFGTDFPFHGQTEESENDRNRLATYTTPGAAFSQWLVAGNSWASPGESSIQFGLGTEQTYTAGFDVDWKIGSRSKRLFGVGAEGSFSMHTSSSWKVDAATTLWLLNPEGDRSTQGFYTHMYWLAPDAAGYWVPLNRVGAGDQPWFITYDVESAWP